MRSNASNPIRLHDGESRRIPDELAVRSYDEVAEEFFKRTGVRMSRKLVHYYLAKAHAKLRRALRATIASHV
jgi:hypothetical protein